MADADPVWGWRTAPLPEVRRSPTRDALARGEIAHWVGTGRYLRSGSNCTPELAFRAGEPPDALYVLKRLRLEPAAQQKKNVHLQREVAALQRIVHAHVVALIDHGVDSRGDEFVVLDYHHRGHCHPGALANAPPSQVLARLRDLARAVDAMHRQGVAHNDINPGNVLLGSDARLILTDFGCASLRIAPDAAVLASNEWRNWTWIDNFRLAKFSYWILRCVFGSFSLPSVTGEAVAGELFDCGREAIECIDIMMRKVPVAHMPRAHDLAEELEHWRARLPE